jgi:methyl-accepting chemotaxis protein PixJ
MHPEPSSERYSIAPLERTTTTIQTANPFKSFLQRHLIGTIIISTCINLGLIGVAAWRVWDTSEHFEATVATQSQGQGSSSKPNYLNEVQHGRQALSEAIILSLTSLGIAIASGSLVVITVRSYIRDREQSGQSLQMFQSDLLKLNQELQQEAQLREQQQAQVSQESATLQTDIGHILDVVSSLETGNLTVRAEVNERATGLIADTLNRLIESLHQIIAVVASSADRVVGNANELEQLAVETARQAQNQTRSIQKIETLIAEVNSISTNSQHQALATIEAVELAKAAVGNGQQEMGAMADGIETLQQGTEQIIRRVQSLTEFVDLAAKFSKDQKRVAALTRVLALNASLLSTRAVKEQDPTQFASLANEFETIATQVNELADDTNQSLATLQHRTNQIQTVTSGLALDVTEIGQLVQKFTSEISKSSQAFTNIQLVTDRVASVGEQVSTSSQDIVRVVSDTLTAIQSIGIIAQNTEHKATVTREQVQAMGNLAQNLSQMVEFFQLKDETRSGISKFFTPADDSTVVKNPHAVYELLQPYTRAQASEKK